jgi:hypothetical protein
MLTVANGRLGRSSGIEPHRAHRGASAPEESKCLCHSVASVASEFNSSAASEFNSSVASRYNLPPFLRYN